MPDAATSAARCTYLAGYAAECLLKAYLIQHMNAQTLSAAVSALNEQRERRGLEPVENIARSAAGHKILYLLQLTDLPQYPAYDQKAWGRVAQWRSSWRYETENVPPSEAAEFLNDIQEVVDWLSPKLCKAAIAEEKIVTTLSFDYAQMSASVREILQKKFGPNAAIRTDEGSSGNVYVRIVSDCFDGLSERTKQDMVWESLHQNLQEDSQAVALVLAFGTDQI